MDTNLETLLLRDGILDPERVAIAADDARRTYRSLAETVIDLGYVDERRFAEWVAAVSGAPLVDPLPLDVATTLGHRVPAASARMRMLAPVGDESGTLSVAMVNPLDETTLQVLRSTVGPDVRAVTGVRSAIERLVNYLYPEQADGDATVLPGMRFTFKDEAPVAPPEPANEEEPFDFSNRTIVASRVSLTELGAADAAAGAEARFGTLMAQPLPDAVTAEPPATSIGPDALARIEQRLDTIAGSIERLQKRLDALDMTLMRFMNR